MYTGVTHDVCVPLSKSQINYKLDLIDSVIINQQAHNAKLHRNLPAL